jgi:hypothetical protein
MTQTKRIWSVAGAIACLLFALASTDASARGLFARGYAGSFYRPGWSHSASISRSWGMASGTRSFSTARGRGITQNFSRSCSGGTCTHNATFTSNSGKTWSKSGSTSRTSNGYSWNRNYNGPNGATATRSGSCTSGVGCSGTTSGTGSKGGTFDVQRSLTPNGSGGANYNVSLTGPNGQTASRTYSYPW